MLFAARIITDRDTGNSRGFGFVTFETVEEASSAIQALDGRVMQIGNLTTRISLFSRNCRMIPHHYASAEAR